MKIAYLVSRFPHLPETFILREMNVLKDKGVDIYLYPLINQKTDIVHDDAKQWLSKAKQSSYFSLVIFKSNVKLFLKKPITFLNLYVQLIIESISNPEYLFKCLVLFPKAIHFADDMVKNEINHIHAHYATYPAFVAWLIHSLTDITYSITVHAHDIYVFQTMLRTKLNLAEKIIAISKFNKHYLIENVDIKLKDKIKVIHCGINPKYYLDAKHPYSNINTFKIMTTGSLQEYKGQMFLLKACYLLEKQGIDFQCTIIGEGKLRSELVNYIKEKKLTKVKLVGAKTEQEVRDLLSIHHCYIQPSIITSNGKMEGIPVSLMEAMATQMIVIASDISGISELVIDQETGFLISEKQPILIKQSILCIMNTYYELQSVAQKGQHYVNSNFNIFNNTEKLLKVFASIVKG